MRVRKCEVVCNSNWSEYTLVEQDTCDLSLGLYVEIYSNENTGASWRHSS